VGLTVANQAAGHLTAQIRKDVFANCRSKLAFQVNSKDDAELLAAEFGELVSAEQLMNLKRYEVVARLAAGGEVVPTATARTLPLPPPTGLARIARDASRRRYGRPLGEVEAELRARHSQVEQPTARAARQSEPPAPPAWEPWDE